MKKQLFTILILLLGGVTLSPAQSVGDEFSLLQSAFGKDKKAIVAEVLNLSEDKANNFWPIYESYEFERQLLSKERFLIINDYLTKFSVIGELEADNLATRTMKNDLAMTKLHSRYYKKFKKSVSALDAAKFLQLDTYIHNTIRNAIQQELPFLEEF